MLGRSSVPALAVLQNKDFRLLWITRIVYEFSFRMELLVLGYLILRLTDSPFQVGLIAMFLFAARPFLAPFAGLIADQLDRQHFLVAVHAAYSGVATMMLVLLITDVIQPWHVFLGILLQGSAKALDDPSRRTAIYDLAGPERLGNAMSLEMMTQTGGRIVGPLIAGILIAWAGFTGAYSAILVLDLTALMLIFRLKLPMRPLRSATQSPVWQSLREGIGHSLSNRMLLGVLLMSLTANTLVFPIEFFIPVIASELLSVGPVLGGILGSAASIGALMGALLISTTRDARYFGQIFVGGTLLFTLSMVSVAWSPWFAVSFTLLLLGGVGDAGFSTMQSTILLLVSAPEIRGRAMGAQGWVIGMGHLIGGPEVGAVASAFGMALAIGVNAGAGIFFILLVTVLTPLVRRPVRAASQPAQSSDETLSPTPLPEAGKDD